MQLNQIVVYQGWGPPPANTTFQVHSSNQMLHFCGSAFARSVNNRIGVTLRVNDEDTATTCAYANASAQHMALVPIMKPVAYTSGTNYAVTVVADPAYPETEVDVNDYFSITILELDQVEPR